MCRANACHGGAARVSDAQYAREKGTLSLSHSHTCTHLHAHKVKSMFEKVQQMTSTMCGPPKGIVFDGYANGDIVFTQVLRVGEKGEREGGGMSWVDAGFAWIGLRETPQERMRRTAVACLLSVCRARLGTFRPHSRVSFPSVCPCALAPGHAMAREVRAPARVVCCCCCWWW